MNGQANAHENEEFTVALSGGGHRASLLALGGLMALVDRGLNRRVIEISSVSGGSLTNGVVAARCNFRSVDVADFDKLAGEFAAAIRRKPLYDARRIAAKVLVVAFVVPVGAALLFDSAWWLLLVVLTAPVTLTLVGRWLRIAIGRVHFADGATLETVAAKDVAHHFCATDLITGMPVTFSTDGALSRRWVPLPPGQRGWAIQRHRAHDDRMATVVRASAAFPGIPPKALRFSDTGAEEMVHSSTGDETTRYRVEVNLSRWAFCADGGIWNNLGTQGLRETGANRGRPILCINASAPSKTAHPIPFWIPGVSVIVSLFRTMTTLSRNTVEPRVDTVRRELERRHAARVAPNSENDPLTVIADMRRVSDAFGEIYRMGSSEDGCQFVEGARSAIPTDEVDAVRNSPLYQAWLELDHDGEIKVATTLSRIASAEALSLLLRGYAGTWLASLHLASANDDELDAARSRRVVTRLRQVAGCS